MSDNEQEIKNHALIKLLKVYRTRHYVDGEAREHAAYDFDLIFRIGDTYVNGRSEEELLRELSRKIRNTQTHDVDVHHSGLVRMHGSFPKIKITPNSRMHYEPAQRVFEPPAQRLESFLRRALTPRYFRALIEPRLHDLADVYRPAWEAGRYWYARYVLIREYALICKDLTSPLVRMLARLIIKGFGE